MQRDALRRWLTPIAASLLAAGLCGRAVAEGPAKIEKIAGSDLPQITLTSEAARRLDIQTATVREERIERWLILGGEVEAAPVPAHHSPTDAPVSDPMAMPTPAANSATDLLALRVRVPLAGTPDWVSARPQVFIVPAEVDDDDDDDDSDDTKAIIVLPPTGIAPGTLPIETAATGASKPATGAFYYEVSNPKHQLVPGQRVRVKLPQPDSDEPHKVIPYSAVIYDASGRTWTYTNPEPLVFVRQSVTIDFIDHDLAVLSEGPAIGTKVVTLGAPELYGAEKNIGH